MELCLVAALAGAVMSLLISGVSSAQCYQCHVNPPPGHNYSTTKLCVNFDGSAAFAVDCPHSTFCVKKTFYLQLHNGVRIEGTLRDCAQQQYRYHDYDGVNWSPKMEVHEPYQDGCRNVDSRGERTTPLRECYCRGDLCNTAPSTNHEGYTDIMGVIVVFNLMKYINSLR